MPRQDTSLRLIVIGPGRAGGSIALAAERAGHQVVGVVTRHDEEDRWPRLATDEPFPEADLALIAVKDDDIADVSRAVAPLLAEVGAVAHLSGFVPVSALHHLQERGLAIGGFHPLQSLPEAEAGSHALAGAFVGIDGDGLAIDALTHLASSLDMKPFRLEDEARPAYHAAAASAANFVVVSLAVSADLFESAGIDHEVSRPLVESVVGNVFDRGAAGSLTGPIARGDVETVVGHLTAAREVSDALGEQFRLLAEATAIRAGREKDLRRWR